jgi:hexokinase
MQPFIAAMLKVRQAFYAAILKSLLRTKSLLQTILNIWVSPSIIKGENVESEEVRGGRKRREEFLEDVDKALRKDVGRERLLQLSKGLKEQFEESLLDNPLCMLPSYNHQLPTGHERGTYLALDVGGSTFRVALIQLSGREVDGSESKILKSRSVKIDSTVKQLKGVAFFDWMAARIEDTLSGQSEGYEMSDAPLSMGMAWSFPIEYVPFHPIAYKSADNVQTDLSSQWTSSRHGKRLPCRPWPFGSRSW